MKYSKKNRLLHLASLVLAGWVPFEAHASDLNGYTTANDATCWLDASCSLARGGNSDVMTVYNPNGSVYQQIFAFGYEETNNEYFFSPSLVQVDPSQYNNYTTLLDPTGSWSDVFGVDYIYGVGYVLSFLSSQQTFPPPPASQVYTKNLAAANPVPDIADSNGNYLTIAYDASQYLSPVMQNEGYTATFQSDIPEPATLGLLVLGSFAASRRRRST